MSSRQHDGTGGFEIAYRPAHTEAAIQAAKDAIVAALDDWKEHERIRNAAPEMLVALKAIDDFWTIDFPEGPEGSREWAGGLGYLSDDTIELWRTIRVAIAKAEGR